MVSPRFCDIRGSVTSGSRGSLPLPTAAVLCWWPSIRSRSAWRCCREELRRRCCGSAPPPPFNLPFVGFCSWAWSLVGVLTPSLVGRQAILAGLLLLLSSFRALYRTLLLHQLVSHPRLRGRRREVGFGGLAKASSDLCRANNVCACWSSLPRWSCCCYCPMPFGLQGENLSALCRRDG
jgi:hypothetical protein